MSPLGMRKALTFPMCQKYPFLVLNKTYFCYRRIYVSCVMCIPKAMGTSFYEYAAGCFSGDSLLSMIVTLSPAPSCGWETWFSCTYGEDLNKLHCPVVPQAKRQLQRVVSSTGTVASKSAEQLARTPATGPASKFLKKRAIQARHDATEHLLFNQLQLLLGKQ